MMRTFVPLILFVSLISGKYLLVETESDEEVNYRHFLSFMLKCFAIHKFKYCIKRNLSNLNQMTHMITMMKMKM